MNNPKLAAPRQSLHKKQQGIATVLLVVLVGVALTATAFGITHSIRSTQEKHVAANAVTHAQTGAWAATEAFSRFLTTLQTDALLQLSGDYPISMAAANNTSYGAITATVSSVTDQGGGVYQVAVNIVNRHAAAKSSAALGLVYEVSVGAPASAGQEIPVALNFYDDLLTEGAITFVGPDSAPTNINVEGDFSALTVGLNNVSTLRVTGSVTVGSQVRVDTILSNDDVTLQGGARASSIQTAGRVFVLGGSAVDTIAANGDVFISATSPVTRVESRANIDLIDGSGHGHLTAGGQIDLGNAGVHTLESVGDITVSELGARSVNIVSEGNLDCPNSQNNIHLGDVSINGVLSPNCVLSPNNTTSYSVLQNNTVNVMDELDPLVIPPVVIDVWELKQYAHYAFEYDAVAGEPKVTVKNINGIPDGEYTLADYANNKRSYICETKSASGICVSPAVNDAYIPVCMGSSVWAPSACLRYTPETNTWKLSEDGNRSISNSAPGIMWFDGNLEVVMGYTYTTMLVTGNFTAAGNFLGGSANYGDSAEMCLATGQSVRASQYSVYQGFYPTDMCDESGNFTPMPAGNIAIASGGYNPDDNGAYSGGQVTLANTARIWGTVLAGTYLDALNSTQIYGYVVAAALAGKSLGDNTLGGGTTIDLSMITENFNPALIPGMSGSSPGSSSGSSSGAPPTAPVLESKVLWSKHL